MPVLPLNQSDRMYIYQILPTFMRQHFNGSDMFKSNLRIRLMPDNICRKSKEFISWYDDHVIK